MDEILDSAKNIISDFPISKFENRLAELQSDIAKITYSDPEYVSTIKELNKNSLIVDSMHELENSLKNYSETKSLLTDPSMAEIAEEELKQLSEKIKTLTSKLKLLTANPLPDDEKKAIIEIRPGVGGVEAALFAQDLFEMYQKYCGLNNMKIDIYSIDYNPEGGITEAIFLVDEEGSFGTFRFESGVHRVQRVPTTEAAGRIHTSTASIVVLPETESSPIEIKPNDLRIDVYRSSGPGGQSVNTTDSAVRITHLPTKIIVTSQQGKSQHKNKETALKVLYSRPNEIERAKNASQIKELRAESIEGGGRSVKIRTYNFPQGRITDHRIMQSWFNINEVMQGHLDEIIQATNSELRKEN